MLAKAIAIATSPIKLDVKERSAATSAEPPDFGGRNGEYEV